MMKSLSLSLSLVIQSEWEIYEATEISNEVRHI